MAGSEQHAEPGAPRIPPGTRADVGLLNWTIARIAGRVAGSGPLNVMTTLGRHRGLFRRWLVFAGGLMPGGTLSRRETELVILRVSRLCGSDYERHHHERIGRRAGLTDAEIARTREGPDADGWTEHDRALLRAVDELHHEKRIGDATWAALRARLDDRRLIELCLLAGHYEMLAGTLNSLGVPVERPRGTA